MAEKQTGVKLKFAVSKRCAKAPLDLPEPELEKVSPVVESYIAEEANRIQNTGRIGAK